MDGVNQKDRKGRPHRFEVLDALRGICACGVVFFHFHTTGFITNSAFARGSWMFVDFFFVLSGFVIYASYGGRLREGYSVPRFMGLRLGRVYPMYIFALFLFFAVDLLLVSALPDPAREPFTGHMSWSLFALNVSFTQIFGFVDGLGWNGPGWSIAAEVWAYLLLALVLKFFAKNPWPVVGLIAVVSVAFLYWQGDPWLDRTFVHALPRCLFGFCLGMAFYRFGLGGPQLSKGSWTALEVLAIAASIAMVSLGDGPWTLIAPLVFAAAIWVFAREGGAASRLFATAPFARLGVLSYSIYILHIFVQACFLMLVRKLGDRGLPWEVVPTEWGAQCVSAATPLADLLSILMLAAVIIASWLTYHYIEAPARTLSRRLLANRADIEVPQLDR